MTKGNKLDRKATISILATVQQEGSRTVKRSINYDPNPKTTRQFYAHIQDEFHYAFTQMPGYLKELGNGS